MNKPWLTQYPAEVPAEIDPARYQSLPELFEESFRRFESRTAFISMGRHLDYGHLELLSRNLAAWLQDRGLDQGARIAIMLPNCLAYPVALTGVLRAGGVVINVNPMYTPRELEHQLNDSGATAIIVLENMAATVEKVLAKTQIRHVLIARLGDFLGPIKGTLVNLAVRHVRKMVPAYSLPQATRLTAALSQGERLRYRKPDIAPHDLAILQYTGGTTGVSKGAMLTHRNLVANILQVEAWVAPVLERSGVEHLHFVCALPLYHVYSLTACALLGMRRGAANILITDPRDIKGFIATLRKYPFNILPAINTLYNGLLNHPDFASLDFSTLVLCNGGGMAVQRAVAERWVAATGVPICEGYGLSETSPVVTSNLPDMKEFTGTIGLPLPDTDIAILDDDGRAVANGAEGEICIRGPQVMAGYWNRPDETAKAMTPDGFFRSGDIGVMNEQGFIRIVDRKKDMILVSGFNVYPNEIEDVVAAHPGVFESAAVGVPDPHSGEAVKLFVIRKDPALSANELMALCKARLTGYKRPKFIEFVDTLPKSNVGKILRRELRPANR
ncbi:long-chain-fatty-acid--CoA ligase [Noviherbaspirillum cavernae]|uniref:Long-chain-fatty-acid--CoA ligase n=1 Tax=Noviherbaspirillum cavernae TaxID=2320862 RepID=A0A418WWE9_9BURK|nr:long-chain-fatty-acid--CoA ligase [Noviherbaspirillum cavernae]RJF96929.1 long-chain-fatty-acid--CoA ligase [Noviherbaspirillum cavernae]